MHISATRPSLVPDAFCWSRMGVEAGEALNAIVARKNLERNANDGVFLWGFGNALGDGIRQLIAREAFPEVLFSPIRGSAASADRNPTAVFAWLDYLDASGKAVPLPLASFITSRGETLGGGRKRQHFALFCQSTQPLTLSSGGRINFGELKNLATRRSVGFSQVTAIVSLADDTCAVRNLEYDIALRARLVDPYYARLTTPIPLSIGDIKAVEMAASTQDHHTWSLTVQEVKKRLRDAVESETNQTALALFAFG